MTTEHPSREPLDPQLDPETDPGTERETQTDPETERVPVAFTDSSTDSSTEPETLEVPLAELRPALEAVLMVADLPLDDTTLASAVGYPVVEVDRALAALAADYEESGRGFELRHVAGGWRYYTREAFAPVVERFVLEGQRARLTQAALETLAVVAYKQPVSRSRVSAIRGVNVDGVMRTLLNRGLVEEAGNDEATGAHLYRTSSYFLERIGVSSIDELPELAPLLPGMDDLEDEQEVAAADLVTAPATTHEASSAGDAAPSSSAEDR